MSMDTIIAGQAVIMAAGRVIDAEMAVLVAKHDAALAKSDLRTPLEFPEKVYHPQQIETRRDKDTGEAVFLRAHGTVESGAPGCQLQRAGSV